MNPEKTKDQPVDHKLGNLVLVGFVVLFLIGCACYYFGIELTDLT